MKIAFCFILIACLFFGCGVPRQTHTTKISEIKKLGMYKPLVHITTYGPKSDTTISLQVQKNLIQSVDDIFPRTMDIYDIDIDSSQQSKYDALFLDLALNVSYEESYSANKVFNVLVKELAKAKIDYALAVIQVGEFSKMYSSKQLADKSITPNLYDVFTLSFLINTKKSNFAYIKTHGMLNADVMDKAITDKLIHALYDKYISEK